MQIDDARLRSDLILARRIEAAATLHVRTAIDAGELAERNSALMVVRQAHALVRELEKWIIARTERVSASSSVVTSSNV